MAIQNEFQASGPTMGQVQSSGRRSSIGINTNSQKENKTDIVEFIEKRRQVENMKYLIRKSEKNMKSERSGSTQVQKYQSIP